VELIVVSSLKGENVYGCAKVIRFMCMKKRVFLEMILVYMLKGKVVDLDDQCAKSHLE
jgi:hypothetical protein